MVKISAVFFLSFLQLITCQKPLWTQHLETAVFTSAGAIKQNGSLPTYAAATWLNQPIEAEALNSSTTGTPVWTYTNANNLAQFRVAVARHIDSYSVGPVDVLVVEYGGFDDSTCNVYGFSSLRDNTPIWSYNLKWCNVYLIDDIYDPIALSDDGSTGFVGLTTNYSADGTLNNYSTAQLYAFNAQTGERIYAYDLGKDVRVGAQHVVTSKTGDYTAWTQDVFIYVVLKNGTLRTAPINKGYETPSNICPQGEFLTYGFMSAIISRWNSTTGVYEKQAEYDGGGQWTLIHSTTSTNGGGTQPDGCLVAFGWADLVFQQVKVEVYNMLTLKQYWQWISDKDISDQTLPNLSFHMNYLGVVTWGDHNSRTPTVFLFNLASGVPLFNYTTPGSMFEVGVVVNNAPIPNLTRSEYLGEGLTLEDKVKNKKKTKGNADPDQVFLVTAGKDVPASEFGNGGDAYAFNLSYPQV